MLPQKDAGGAPLDVVVVLVATVVDVGFVLAGGVAAVAVGLDQRWSAAPAQLAMSSRAVALPPGSVRHSPEFGLTSSPLDSWVQSWAAVALQGYQSMSVPPVVPAADDVEAAALGAHGAVGVGRPLLARRCRRTRVGDDRVALGVQRVLVGQAQPVDRR